MAENVKDFFTTAWAKTMLHLAGVPTSKDNIKFVASWHAAEGAGGAYNPLNVTLTPSEMPRGATPLIVGGQDVNGPDNPVVNFASPAQSASYTSARLRQPFAASILADLKRGDQQAAITAIGTSGWGTNPASVKQIYDAGGPSDIPGGSPVNVAYTTSSAGSFAPTGCLLPMAFGVFAAVVTLRQGVRRGEGR